MKNLPKLKETLKIKFKDWLLDSTIHGFPKILKNDRLSLKFIWIFCIFLSIGSCCYFTINSIINFTKFEVTTLVRRNTKFPLELPAISICHNEMLLSRKGHDFKVDFLKSANIGNILNSTFFSQIYQSVYQESINIDIFDYFSKIYSFSYNTSDQDKKSIGFKLESYMISCFLSTNDCSKDDFIWYYDQFFGNCYILNSGSYKNGSKNEFYKQTIIGPIGGIRLEFISKTFDEVNELSVSKGIHLSIFDPKTRVNPNRGLELASKYQTNIKIKKRIIKKIPYPYSECLEDHSKFYSSEIYQASIKQTQSYSQTFCFDICYQSRVISKCNCSDSNKPFFKMVPVCFSLTELYCSSQHFINFISDSSGKKICAKDCPLECEQTEYDVSISFTDYPTNLRAEAIVELLNKKNNSKNYTLDFAKENSLRVNIFYDSLEYEEIQELKKMEIVDLVSSIGGLFGLFIGISVLSFAEIIELIFLILHAIFDNINRKKVIQVQPASKK